MGKRICFVIMPIGKKGTEEHSKFLEIYSNLIKPAVEASGFNFDCIRADEISKPGSIIRDIIQKIYLSEVVIADMTGRNANVFYELGARHALSTSTILISQSTDDIPFDLKDYRTIIYKADLSGVKEFNKEIRQYIREIINNPGYPDNPIQEYLVHAQKKENETTILSAEATEKKEYALLWERVKTVFRSLNLESTKNSRANAYLSNLNSAHGISTKIEVFNDIYVPAKLLGANPPSTKELFFVCVFTSKFFSSSLISSIIAEMRAVSKNFNEIPEFKLIFIIVTNSRLDYSISGKLKNFTQGDPELATRELFRSLLFEVEIWDDKGLKQKEVELNLTL